MSNRQRVNINGTEIVSVATKIKETTERKRGICGGKKDESLEKKKQRDRKKESQA